MEKKKIITSINKLASSLTWILVSVLLSQNLVIPVMATSFGTDQKNFFYTPVDPGVGTPPVIGSPSTPTYTSPPGPVHGGSSGGAPPVHGGSSGGAPPVHRTPPTHSSGGYHGSPPSRTPSHNPSPPVVIPGSPVVPTPPFLPDPNSNPFTGTCDYWRTHPGLIWGLCGWWATIGNALGAPSLPGLGAHMNLQEALSNKRTDGYGALYREGTASLLNSMVNNKFPFTTKQVRDRFSSALGSDKSAAAQARLFKLANEGKLKPRA